MMCFQVIQAVSTSNRSSATGSPERIRHMLGLDLCHIRDSHACVQGDPAGSLQRES